MNLIVVGDGGIGSNLTLPLLKLIKYHRDKNNIDEEVKIKIIDGDRVELKNVIRQHFISDDNGKFKSDITAAYLNQICKDMKAKDISAESYPFYLKEDNIDIIGESDIVFVGVDNYITRRIIEDKAVKLNDVLIIFGGNEYHDGDVNVLHRFDKKTLTPLYSEKHPEIKIKDKFPDEISCEEASKTTPQLILANMSVALYMLEVFYNFINGKIEWHEKFFDVNTGKTRTV